MIKITVAYICIALAASCGFAAETPSDPDLLFALDYETWSMTASHAGGNPKCLSFENPELQMRMFPGVAGKGNGICLENTEYCSYQMKGNFNPKQGAVSLWISPFNWRIDENGKLQSFFKAASGSAGYTMWVAKEIYSGWICFGISYKDAPGTVKQFGTRVKVGPGWTGQWHKIDAVWNNKGMKLYIDGLLPAANPSVSVTPSTVFPTPIDFPEAPDDGVIEIGTAPWDRQSPLTNIAHKTGFDEIKIYGRPLTDTEIKDAYEKYFPASSKLKLSDAGQIVTVPRLVVPVAPDGVIDAAEWAGAAVVPAAALCGMGQALDPRLSAPDSRVYLKHDGKSLHIAARAGRPCAVRNVTEPDGPLWTDDSVEIMFERADKKIVHLIVNGNGVIYDDLDGDKSFSSEAAAKTSLGKDSWSAELSIPLKSIDAGGALEGKTLRGNFCVTCHDGGRPLYASWSPVSGNSYTDVKGFGRVIFGAGPGAVRLERLGNLERGEPDIFADAVPSGFLNGGALKGIIKDENSVLSENSEINGRDWKPSCPAGRLSLLVEAKKGGGTLFRYEKLFSVNQPMELSYACHAARKEIDVETDLSGAGPEVRSAIDAGTLSGEAKVVSADGASEFSAVKFKISSVLSKIKLPLPSNIPAGKHLITITVAGEGLTTLSKSSPFRVPDMTPYSAKAGADHTVPEPWKAVADAGDGVFKVWGREYKFDGGPFPSQIISDGKDIISVPPKMFVRTGGADTELKWSGFTVKKDFEDYLTLSGAGAAGDLKLAWSTELWFDGMCKTDIKITPAKETQIDSLYMTWAVAPESGKFVLSPVHTKWDGDKTALRFEPGGGWAGDFQVWLTGHKNGLFWQPLSNANWANKKDEKQILVKWSPESVSVRANIISEPRKTAKELSYPMIFMGTPAKAPPAGFREFHFDGINADYRITGMGTPENKVNDDDATTPASHIPLSWDKYKKFAKESADTGKGRCVMYSMADLIGPVDDEYDWFGKDWEKIPAYQWGFKVKPGMEPSFTRGCCGGEGSIDLMAWRADKLMREVPELGGIYYDIAQVEGCENPEHGHGGLDAFGKPFMTQNTLFLRSFFLRISKMLHKNGKIMVLHAHSRFNPAAHSFGDYWCPGEQFFDPLARNIEWFYTEDVPMEQYQAEMTPLIRGCGIQFIPEYVRNGYANPKYSGRPKNDFWGAKWALKVMTPALLHDFDLWAANCNQKVPRKWMDIKAAAQISKAEFTGYWDNDAVKSDSKNVLVSYYRWAEKAPFSALIIAGNISREEKPSALSLDRNPPGFNGAGLKFTDLWENKELSEEDLKTAKIAPGGFLMIGVSAK